MLEWPKEAINEGGVFGLSLMKKMAARLKSENRLASIISYNVI